MKLRDLLDLIKNVAENNNINEPLIVGGTPRDKLLHLIKPDELNDLDITTGNKLIHNLGRELELELKKQYTIKVKQGDDGHLSIIFPGNKFKLDCSSFFTLPNIDELLLKKGIKNPTDLQREMFSRDFNVNSLLMTLDLKTIKDPTREGLKDIKNRVLNTCLDIDTTLRYNPNRIIRTVYLSAKLDFDVNPAIIKWISENKDLVRLSRDSYLTKNIDKAMSKNPDRALYIINKTNLWSVIPVTDQLRPHTNKKVTKASKNQSNTIKLYRGLMELDYNNLISSGKFSPARHPHNTASTDFETALHWAGQRADEDNPALVIEFNAPVESVLEDNLFKGDFKFVSDFTPTNIKVIQKGITGPIGKTAQLRKNFDIGEGVYSNMEKYKSISDFRRKRRNKRKKQIKDILKGKLVAK